MSADGTEPPLTPAPSSRPSRATRAVDLPPCPRRRLYSGKLHGDRHLAECEWAPSDGLDAAAFLSPWLSRSELSAASLPIIVTYAKVGAVWRPYTIAAESAVLPGELIF